MKKCKHQFFEIRKVPNFALGVNSVGVEVVCVLCGEVRQVTYKGVVVYNKKKGLFVELKV